MKLVIKGIETVFECTEDEICTVVIENQRLFYEAIDDIESQIQGMEGKSVLSDKNQILKMNKYAEMILQFVPFDLNRKTLINRIISHMEKIAVDVMHFEKTNELLAAWEKYCIDLEFELPIDLEFTKISIDTLLKASGVMLSNEYESLAEKILDYIHLVEYFECKKLFVLVNMRSFAADEEMQRFMDSALSRNCQIILLENKEYPLLKKEKRHVVDADLCEICYD